MSWCTGELAATHHLPSMHGISRSPFFLVSYLVSSCSASLEEAQRVVRGARPICQPNPGFLTQLETFYPYGALAETARLRRRCGGGDPLQPGMDRTGAPSTDSGWKPS